MTSLKLGALGLARTALLLLVGLTASTSAWSALTATPLTWNIVGLDSNTPATGPQFFPVGARICSNVATTNVQVDFVWDSANPNVNLRAGSLAQVIFPSIGAGACADAYFEVAVTRVPAAFDTTRGYHITATDLSGTASTPTPRELYVEHLVSQARNSVTSVLYGPVGGPLTAVAPGGEMNLVVGSQYDIRLEGGTATGGYEQFAAFINFSNAIFRITDVLTTYNVVAPPRVVSPNDRLYADACLWENDPANPNYRVCLSTGKAGGSPIATTYTILIVGGGGSSETLNTLLYDFSGSSYHYNADFGVGARITNIIDPASAGIAKAFLPSSTNIGGVSTLRITLTNPNAGALSGYNVVDNLPANLVVATPPAASTTGCGSPTLTAVAGSSTVSFSNGTVAANSSCVISVNVAPTAIGALINTTNNLFVGTVDTGNNASATLTVNDLPPPPACTPGLELARWDMNVAQGTGVPPPFTAKRSNVATAVSSFIAAAGAGSTIDTVNGSPTANSWSGSGWASDSGAVPTAATASFFDFTVDSSQYKSNPAEPVRITFNVNPISNWANPSNNEIYIHGQVDGGAFTTSQTLVNRAVWTNGLTALASGVGDLTTFRINARGRSNGQPDAPLLIDSIVLTGCGVPEHPNLTKGFAPQPIGVGGVSTLTFTLTNSNSIALTQAAFTDALPAGLEVAPTPLASNTCGGVWAPLPGATNLSFTGGTIPIGGSCTVQVDVTATTPGPKANTSGSISTLQTGTNIGPSGSASATLTALSPPVINKTFAPNPILPLPLPLPNGVSTLTFVVVNPNPDHPISSVSFSDTFPIAPGAMVVATAPNASTTGCGAPTFAPVAGAGSINFSGGTIAANGTCFVRVNVTVPVVGSYSNASGSVSHIVNGSPFSGNSASDILVVNPPNPSATLLKQIAADPAGPWLSYLSVAPNGNVFYRITIENTGDVPLSSVAVSDPDYAADVSACGFPTSLPVADAFDDDHIASCIFNTVTPITAVAASLTNTATVTATGVAPDDDSAVYATTGLTLAKSANPTTYTSAGETINYSFLVTNSGFAVLSGPVTITDPLVAATCPALTTVGDLDAFFDPGESITCTGSYVITATDVTNGSVSNTATASAGGATSPPSSVTVTTPPADLSITKSSMPNPATPGLSITYTIVVSNAGPSTAINASINDDLPATLSNIIWSCSAAGTSTCGDLNGAGDIATTANLVPSNDVTYTVTATIDPAARGLLTNTATVTPPPGLADPDTGDQTATDNNPLTPSADVSVLKTLTTAGPFSAGQSITYTLFVANAGPSDATNVQVTDTPTNLAITAVAGGGCVALPCTLPSLASGADTTITVTATINAAGAFDNSATVTASEPDPVPPNNTDNVGNDGVAAPSADVSVVKTLTTVGPFTVGQSITYTLFVANAGPSDATNVQVTDTPSNLTITGVGGGGCVALPCTIANLASGTNTTITVTATIDAAGAFDNSATVSADEPDPDSSNNTDNTGNNGITGASADVSVVKTLTTVGPFIVGQTITYTLFVANAGPSTATSVQVTDLPQNLTITNVSGGCASLPCTIPSLASGADTTITVTATIDAAGAFDNSATVSATEPDPDPSDNTDDTGNNGTVVSIDAVDDAPAPVPATGGSTATVVANDTINGGTPAVIGSNVTLTPGAAPTPAAGSITMNADGTITVAAGTTPGSYPYPYTICQLAPNDTVCDSAIATVIVGESADLSVTKVADTLAPSVGSSITFTLTVSNAGPSAATAVVLNDLLPAGYTFVSSTPSQGTYVSGTGVWTVGNLANGANATLGIVATVNATGPYANTATVTSSTPDPDPSDDTDTETPTPIGGPPNQADLAVLKTGPATITRGQNLAFTIRVENRGPDAALNARLTDPTPPGLVFVSTSGAYSGPFPCALGNMASGEVRNLTATYFVPADYSGPNMIVNTVNALSDSQDPTPGDSSSSSSVLVPAGQPNLALIKVVPVDARWALLLLAGLVMLIASRRIER